MRRHVPKIACNYWDFRDELSIEGDLLMKGERIIILTMCRDSILADLHKSLEGAKRSLSLARTCIYWPGMEADIMDYIKRCVMKMPIEMLHPHEVPTGPWVKLGMDFFQDDSENKFLIIADYFSKFPFIFPIALTHHHKTLRYLRDLFLTEGVPAVVMTDNGPPFNGEEFKRFAWEFDFKHQTSSLHFHQSNGFIEAMVKKVKTAYKKTWISKCPSKSIVTATWYTTSKGLAISSWNLAWTARTRSCHALTSQTRQHTENMLTTLEIQNMQKEHFDWAHIAKDKWVLMVREQVRFFLNKMYGMKLKWLIGTVRVILEWGRSYIIEGPNGKKYRRNRAHLKPICHDGSSFQDLPRWKGRIRAKSENTDSFQDPRPKQKKTVMFKDDPIIFESILNRGANETSDSTSHSSHQIQHFSSRSPSSSPPAQLSSREKLVSPAPENHTAQRHPAFIRPQDVDTQLTTGLAPLVKETSPLAPYKIQRSAKRKARQAFSTMW